MIKDIIEVVGYKGVVGNATYQWFNEMKSNDTIVIGRDINDPLPEYTTVSFVCLPEGVVEDNCREIARYAELIVIRSTVPPKTCTRLQRELHIHICHNPEFLREATAVQDIFNPDYILLGTCCSKHSKVLKKLYSPACVNIVTTNTQTSEMVKIVTNNYLACLVSFWNEVEKIARATGVSGHNIGAITSLDKRVVWYGARWHHQFGGKCLPKELIQMITYANSLGVPVPILEAIQDVNKSL